jgi:hypothetical protein
MRGQKRSQHDQGCVMKLSTYNHLVRPQKKASTLLKKQLRLWPFITDNELYWSHALGNDIRLYTMVS